MKFLPLIILAALLFINGVSAGITACQTQEIVCPVK